MNDSFNKREFGFKLEEFALKQLQSNGCCLVEQNFTSKFGEIDLIVSDQESLVFVEVRYRKNNFFGGASNSVDGTKQKKISRTAAFYLQTNKITQKTPCRFDVFAIEGSINKLSYNWIKDAFSQKN